MLIALVLLLAFIGRHLQSSAALQGGIGFGTFIDELGKFITSNNNYFFQPAIPLIYMIFVLLFLCFRELEKQPSPSERAYLANALYLLAQDAPCGLSEEDKNEVLWLLRAYDAHDERLHALAETVEQLPVMPPSKAGVLDRMVGSIRNLSVRFALSLFCWHHQQLLHRLCAALYRGNGIRDDARGAIGGKQAHAGHRPGRFARFLSRV